MLRITVMTRYTNITERSNLAMAMDAASRGPVHINFFDNHGVLLCRADFMKLTPERLRQMQQDLGRKMLCGCSPEGSSLKEKALPRHDHRGEPAVTSPAC